MKKTFLLILAVLMVLPMVNADWSIENGTNVNELSTSQKYDCYRDYYLHNKVNILGGEDSLLGEAMASVLARSDVFLNLGGSSLQQRNAWCANTVLQKTYYEYTRNITDNILKEGGTLTDQIGLEDYYFEAEKTQILNNINGAWVYVLLLFELFIELMMIMFYVAQLFIVTYVLFVALPKGFLYLRDGITVFMIKRRRGR